MTRVEHNPSRDAADNEDSRSACPCQTPRSNSQRPATRTCTLSVGWRRAPASVCNTCHLASIMPLSYIICHIITSPTWVIFAILLQAKIAFLFIQGNLSVACLQPTCMSILPLVEQRDMCSSIVFADSRQTSISGCFLNGHAYIYTRVQSYRWLQETFVLNWQQQWANGNNSKLSGTLEVVSS